MGNSIEKDNFYMHMKLIGEKMDSFYDNLNNSDYLNKIRKFWDIDPVSHKDNLEQIISYFDDLNELFQNEEGKTPNLRDCLIVQVKNTLSKEVNVIIEQMDNLLLTYRMPLVLFLTTEKCEKNINIDKEKYESIDPRLIFIQDYPEDKALFEKEISPLLLRLCSIHNDLGDRIEIGNKDKDKVIYNLITDAYPFNLNIACIGKAGQGKSTGVNEILNSYKAKETNNGSSQTKKLSYYQVDKRPIRILDIPGFESENTVKETTNKFKECGERINEIKQCIHIILYFFNYSVVKETRSIGELEYPIFEEITNHKSSRLIYVITHSKKNLKEKNKKLIFEKINSGLWGTKKEIILKNKEMLKANENNVVFVNFRKDEDNPEVFGKKELFQKIHDFFIESESYKKSLRTLNEQVLEENIEILKAQARSELFPCKFWGAAAGIVPFGDFLLQKFVIRKDALKKAGQIFGIEAKFVDEDNAKEKEEEKKKIKEIKDEPKIIEKENKEEKGIKIEGVNIISDYFDEQKKSENEKNEENNIQNNKEPDYIQPGIDKKKLITTVEGKDLMKDSTQNQISKVVGGSIQVSVIAQEANNVSKIVKHSAQIAEIMSKTENFVSQSRTGLRYISDLDGYFQVIDEANELRAAGSGASLFKFFGIGTIIGIGLGAYCTHRFCENLLDKFADYYRKNAGKITNSYEKALSYFRDFNN